MIAEAIDIEKLKHPIGKFKLPENITQEHISKWIVDIELLPEKLERELEGVKDLSLTYRPDGWSIQQIVHHYADSHINGFLRFKWILTEDQPTIKPYQQDNWAASEDSIEAPISASLKLLTGLHKRWTILLRSLSEEDFQRVGIHPEHGNPRSILQLTALICVALQSSFSSY